MAIAKRDSTAGISNYERFVYLSAAAVSIWAGVALWQTAEARIKLADYLNNKATLREWIDLDFRLHDTLGFGLVLIVIFVASLATWSFQLHKFLDEFSAPERKWSRGWTIGGWLIPIGFLIVPYLVIRESQQKIDRDRNFLGITAIWWASSWVAVILGYWATQLQNQGLEPKQYYIVRLIHLGLILLTCALASFMVHETSLTIAELNAEQSNDETPNTSPNSSIDSSEYSSRISSSVDDVAERIRVISHLRVEGLISEDEFKAKKQEIIESI